MELLKLILATSLTLAALTASAQAAQGSVAPSETTALVAFVGNHSYCAQVQAGSTQTDRERRDLAVAYGTVIDSMPNSDLLDVIAYIKSSCQRRASILSRSPDKTQKIAPLASFAANQPPSKAGVLIGPR